MTPWSFLRSKRAQDILYIHDTLELFGASLEDLRALWSRVRPQLAAKTATTVSNTAAELFREVTDAIRTAARIPRDRQLTPERIRSACDYGLREILGDAD